MEIASSQETIVRRADLEDSEAILRLLRAAKYRHLHADWHLPVDWLGHPGFYVAQTGPREELAGCLAAAPDPPPVAWVRVAALRQDPRAVDHLLALLDKVVPVLEAERLTNLAWLAVEAWPAAWLDRAGFSKQQWICTYVKRGLDHSVLPSLDVNIRPALQADMTELADLEAVAFDPLWRHSAQGLRLALRQAACFELAQIDEAVVGFYYGVRGAAVRSGHLVRITVHPACQGQGVGSALVAAALKRFAEKGIDQVSLNTQVDNLRSHRLYRKFGFERQGPDLPVWIRALSQPGTQ